MNDRVSQEQRSYNMSRIKGKDTSIEVKARKYLYHKGYRYRKNYKKLPGTPDIVLEKYKTVIFVNGCFWHHHANCKLAVIPKTREEYWVKKITRNTDKDVENYILLRQLGYKVITVWECELKCDFDTRMKVLEEEIEEGMEAKYEEYSRCRCI